MATAAEVIVRFSGDRRQLKQVLAEVRTDLSRSVQQQTAEERQQVQAAISLQRQRSAALIKAANDRLREEARAAREVTRINAETARQATAQERIRERAAKTLADVQIREAKRAAREIENQLKSEREAAVALQRSLAQGSRGSSFLAGAAGGVTALLGISAINEIREAGQAWLDYSSKLENTRIAFTTMLGSAQLAEDHLKELQAFALKTPFQFGELIDASQRMQALGFNAQQVIPVLTDVGNAVAAAGGGSERLDRVVLALSQIQSKGKVMTQELNQLAEAGIPAFRILQETLHKSRAEIVELVKDGEISSKVFLDAFQKFSQQNFGGLMEAQSRTFAGAMSNIKDALLQTSATAFEPLFEKLSQTAKGFADLATNSRDFQDKLKAVGTATATIFDGLVEAVLAFRDAVRLAVTAITAQFTLLTESAKAASHAMAAVFFFGFAAGRQAVGDTAGATRALRVAQDELKLSAEAAKKALESQGEVILTLSSIYRGAEARAKALREEQEKQAALKGFASDVGPGAGILRKKSVESDFGDAEKAKKGSDPAAAAKRVAEIQLRAALDGFQAQEEAFNRQLKRQEINYERYVAELTVLENARSAAVVAGLIKEQIQADKLRSENAKQVATEEIKLRLTQEKNRHTAFFNKLEDDRLEITRRITEFTENQNKEVADSIVKSSAWMDKVNDLIKSLAKQGIALTATQEHWLRFNAMIGDSKERMESLIRVMREATDLVPKPNTIPIPDLTDAQRAAEAGAAANKAAGAPPPGTGQSAIDQLFESINKNLSGNTQSAALKGLEALTSGFSALGDAVGSTVEAFVLYGKAGTSARKVTAEIIAGVARQAAVKAIFELAEGFAALALAFFGLPNAGPSATAHFTAAAIYGGIAGVAALAGRFAAGNSFSQQSASGSGANSLGSSRNGGSRAATTSEPKAVEINRGIRQQQTVYMQPIVNLEVTMKGEATEGFKYLVEKASVTSYREGGALNNIVRHAIGDPGFQV